MKFISDETLGKLAKYLRMLGYDTMYYKQNNANELIEIANEQERILLTRNPRIKEKMNGKGFLLITQDDPKKQLEEVINKFNIFPDTEMFCKRCLKCNEELITIKKEDVEGKVHEHILNS